jgi:integrase/recombinase XerD
VTGLRLGEALNLQCRDIDWAEGVLTIRRTKFGKSRLVPLHASTVKVLAAFAKRRDRFFAERSARTVSHFFVTKFGTPLPDACVYRVFWALSRQIGIRAPGSNRGPRLHDFRHYPDSPLTPCCAGTAPERTSSAGCQCSPPTSVMHR